MIIHYKIDHFIEAYYKQILVNGIDLGVKFKWGNNRKDQIRQIWGSEQYWNQLKSNYILCCNFKKIFNKTEKMYIYIIKLVLFSEFTYKNKIIFLLTITDQNIDSLNLSWGK